MRRAVRRREAALVAGMGQADPLSPAPAGLSRQKISTLSPSVDGHRGPGHLREALSSDPQNCFSPGRGNLCLFMTNAPRRLATEMFHK